MRGISGGVHSKILQIGHADDDLSTACINRQMRGSYVKIKSLRMKIQQYFNCIHASSDNSDIDERIRSFLLMGEVIAYY